MSVPREPLAELPPTGNTARTQPENRAFFPALDGLRAVAFLMVFGQHYLSLAWGWAGVNVFFVLSGFLITGILFDSQNDPHRARNFYIRRTLRIFPLYYGLFAVLLLLTPVIHWHWDRLWLAWPLYLGNFLRFLSPAATVMRSPLEYAADGHLTSQMFPRTELYFGHLWSLCVEEQFYLLWPWVVFAVRDRRRLLAFCTFAVIAGPLLRLFLQAHAPAWMLTEELLYRATPSQADALLLGGLIALLWRGKQRTYLLRVARYAALAGTLTVAWYLAFAVRGWQMLTVPYPHWTYTGGLLFVDLYSAALILCALREGLVFRILHLRPLRWIGRLTYGAYVLHDILHDLFIHIVVHTAGSRVAADIALRNRIAAVLALPCTLLLAWLSFRFFESPFLDLKERWTIRPSVAPGQRSPGPDSAQR